VRAPGLPQDGSRDELVARLEDAAENGVLVATPRSAAAGAADPSSPTEDKPKMSIAERAAMVSATSASVAVPKGPSTFGAGGRGGDGPLTLARIEKLRPYQLKAECRKRGLDATGDRQALAERLKAVCDGGDEDEEEEPEPEPTAAPAVSAKATDDKPAPEPEPEPVPAAAPEEPVEPAA